MEGEEDALDKALIHLKESLEEREDIEQVLYPPTMDWVEENAPWAISDDQFEAWVSVSSNPNQLDQINDLQLLLKEKKLHLFHYPLV